MTGNQIQRAIVNYKRDIQRFKKAARQWPDKRALYLQAVENLQAAVNIWERKPLAKGKNKICQENP